MTQPASKRLVTEQSLTDGPAVKVAAKTFAKKSTVPLYGPQFRLLTIVVYHEIALATFQADLDLYQEWNYTTVSCDDITNYLNGTGTLPEKPLLVTFDDGYVSQYNAGQELFNRGMKGVFYITTGWLDGEITGASFGASGTVMTWTQAQQLRTWGMDIQSHTRHHINMTTQSATDAAAEFTQSKARLEAQIPGLTVRHLAYPFGGVSQTVIDALTGAGCLTARTVRVDPNGGYPGPNLGQWSYASTNDDLMQLPCAGSGAGLLYQANYHHTLARQEQLVPDFDFKGGGKGWSLAAGATVTTDDLPAGQGLTHAVTMPQQATSVQTQTSKPIYVGNFAVIEWELWIKTVGMASVAGRLNLVLVKSDGQTTYQSLSPAPGVTQSGTTDWTKYTYTYQGDHNVVFVTPQLYVQTSGTPTGTTKFAGLKARKAVMAPVIPR